MGLSLSAQNMIRCWQNFSCESLQFYIIVNSFSEFRGSVSILISSLCFTSCSFTCEDIDFVTFADEFAMN